MASETAVMEKQRAGPEQAHLRSSKDHAIPLQEATGPPTHPETSGPSSVFSGTGHVVRTKERWNSPRINIYRLAAIFFAFIVFGMNDASYGALVPYVRSQSAMFHVPRSSVEEAIPC